MTGRVRKVKAWIIKSLIYKSMSVCLRKDEAIFFAKSENNKIIPCTTTYTIPKPARKKK